MVIHSGGSFLGCSAIEGLAVKTRRADHKTGGVIKIVFLSGAVFPDSFKLESLPFYTITYCGWRVVPSVYLVCEEDQVISPPLQLQLAELASSKVEKGGTGHMPHLSVPQRVMEVVKTAAREA